jgi:hypothetical protein
VEVLGRYSNLSDQGEPVQALLEMTRAGPKQAKVRTPRQAQHRLNPVGVGELVAQYRAGAEINQLATHFNVNRDTIFSILNRRQVVPRTVTHDTRHDSVIRGLFKTYGTIAASTYVGRRSEPRRHRVRVASSIL